MQRFLTFLEYQQEIARIEQSDDFNYNTAYRSFCLSSNWHDAYSKYQRLVIKHGFDKDAVNLFFFENNQWNEISEKEKLNFFFWNPETLPQEIAKEILQKLEKYVKDEWLTTYSAIKCFPNGRPDTLLYTGSRKMCDEYDSHDVVIYPGTYSQNVCIDPETNKTHWS